jgi:hypothetical protein
MNLFVGRPFQAVVAAKISRFRRPEKGVLHFFAAYSGYLKRSASQHALGNDISSKARKEAAGSGGESVSTSASSACFLLMLKIPVG